MPERVYAAIDLKSFYASVECVERGLDAMTTNLVVADASRTEKTICLAVSPSLKAHGIPGRPRLFEVVQRVKQVNAERRRKAPGYRFSGKSSDAPTLQNHPELELDYIIAPPRMAHYMKFSTEIYSIYLKYVAPEDIHVYSIDEVFIDLTHYLPRYKMTARQMVMTMIRDVLNTTSITATAGIGTNMYLCKVAMDIVAKHIPADENGVRIAELDEQSYREQLWDHRPLTDFWRVGPGYRKKLEAQGIFTMGDIARCSLGQPEDFYNEEMLYKLFGVNAELLIDHAWGWEPCTIADVRAYKPSSNSLGAGQVLQFPYSWEKAKLVVREMADALALELVKKGLVTDQIVLTLGYDIESLTDPEISKKYHGPVTVDRYGRKVPKQAHGSINLPRISSSTKQITEAAMELFDRITNPDLLFRRMNITANHVVPDGSVQKTEQPEQMDLFTDYAALQAEKAREDAALEKEKRLQHAMLELKKKYGKSAVLKGMNLEEGATAIDRNGRIGGHKA